MHIRKYVKWRQIENGSVLFNTQTGDWLTLNKNATFIFLQRYVNYNPMGSIAENLVMLCFEAKVRTHDDRTAKCNKKLQIFK